MRRSSRYRHLIVIALLASGSAWAGQLITGQGGSIIAVTETASNGQIQTNAYTTTPQNAVGVSNANIVVNGPPTSGLGTVPALRIGAQPTNAAAATALDNAIQPYLASEAKALQAAAEHGTTGAFFSYGQNIQVAGKPVQLIASMWVPTQGSYEFLGVKVGASASESVLYVTYQQSQPAALLPASWTLPGAGDLTWSLATFDMSGSGIGATLTVTSTGTPTTIATNGLYDEPRLDNTVIDNCTAASGDPLLCDQPNPGQTYPATVNGQTVTFDHNVGLDLMIQKAVLPLMTQTGAVQAIVDYGRTVTPV